MGTLITAADSEISDLLRAGIYSVPVHQRFYDWEAEHVQILLEDLAEVIEENVPCHFLGSIMLIEKGDSIEVNDGQQRLLTFSMICANLCKRFYEEGNINESNDLLDIVFDKKKNGKKTWEDVENMASRIIPPAEDRATYSMLVRGHHLGAKNKMAIAWNCIEDFLNEEKHKDLKWQKKLFEVLTKRIPIVKIVVDEGLDPNGIFEVQNSRGKQLEQVDLLKNYILSCLNNTKYAEKLESIDDSFNKLYNLFGGKLNSVEKYMRCSIQIKYGFINEKGFFKKTKYIFKKYKKEERAGTLYKLISDISSDTSINIYKIVNIREIGGLSERLAQDASKLEDKRNLRQYLADMRKYHVTYPVSVSLLKCYVMSDPEDREEVARFSYSCIKLFASFMQRTIHITPGQFRPSEYEKPLVHLGESINYGDISTIKYFVDFLKGIDKYEIMNDKKYTSLFTNNLHAITEEKAKYILMSIVTNEQSDLIVKPSDCALEYILPKASADQSSWKAFSESEATGMARSLGNLTLLHKKDKLNDEQLGKNFPDKKSVYSDSIYNITSEVAKEKDWSPDTVRKRLKRLVENAKDIWNFTV